uniref:de novo protein M7 n=1 Tax=unidentified TaxID=32644 RepID=UPI00017BDAF0|nr:Chain A, de novo protein M7 [unidentified]
GSHMKVDITIKIQRDGQEIEIDIRVSTGKELERALQELEKALARAGARNVQITISAENDEQAKELLELIARLLQKLGYKDINVRVNGTEVKIEVRV